MSLRVRLELSLARVLQLKTRGAYSNSTPFAVPTDQTIDGERCHGWIMDDLGGSYRFTRIPSQASVRYRFALVESKATIRPTEHTRSLPCLLLPFTRFLAPFPGRRFECVWSCRLLACGSTKPGERIQTAPFSPCLQTKPKTGSVFKQHPFGPACRRGTYSNNTPMASPISLPQHPSGFLSTRLGH